MSLVGVGTYEKILRTFLISNFVWYGPSNYICVTYGYYLRGYEVFWVDFQRIIYGIHIGKYYRREPHVIVSMMGIFKGEYGYCMYLITLKICNPVKN